MTNPPSISLQEPEVEATVLGTLITSPDALSGVAADLRPEWFCDVAGRLLAETVLKLHHDGLKVSAAALKASLPMTLDGNGIGRGQFIAGLMTQAVAPGQLAACIGVLRDRWARRDLLAMAEAAQSAANDAGSDPYETAAILISAADNITVSRTEILAGSLGASIDQLFESYHSPRQRAATTGIPSLDKALGGGYRAGQEVIIAGRPGMCKSSFAASSLRATAEAGHGVALFSLEMGADEVAARALADVIGDVRGPYFGSVLNGQFTTVDGDALIEARARLHDLPFYVDASPSLTFSQIAARARRRKAAFEAKGVRLDVVCVDHMGLVQPSDRYRGNKVAETGEVSRAAKVLAKELDCCVVMLCQLSREVEKRDDKRPVLSDLRWSGEIEQDADVVAFLYREHYYLSQRPDADPVEVDRARHRLEFLIRKNRNGETRDIALWCSVPHSSIREAA